jgi:cell division protein ZapA (FtsZ GTPase activity inhibitor)
MLMRLLAALLVASSVVALSVVSGCSQPSQETAGVGEAPEVQGEDDYNPHDVPITEEQKAELRERTAKFADAVATLKQFSGEIEEETAAGIPENPFKAHQALDQADLLLQWLPEIARNSGVPKEHWEAVNTSANDLRTLFEQVHQNIDNKQDPNFAAVAGEIDQKLAGLEEIAAAQPSDAASEG